MESNRANQVGLFDVGRINKVALKAIRESKIDGQSLADLFRRLDSELTKNGCLVVLSYLSEDEIPAEGELVPTVTLSLKPYSRVKTT